MLFKVKDVENNEDVFHGRNKEIKVCAPLTDLFCYWLVATKSKKKKKNQKI